MYSLEPQIYHNIRCALRAKYPSFGVSERAKVIELLVDEYEMRLEDDQHPEKVSAYMEYVEGKSDEELAVLMNEKNLL